MKDWWKYVAGAGIGGLICGAAGMTGGLVIGDKSGRTVGYNQGYEKGYEVGYNDGHQEPKMMVFQYDKQGIEGICIELNQNKVVCSFDIDDNGSVDVMIYDLENKKIEQYLGKDDCLSKTLRKLESGNSGQNQEKPKTPL